MVAQLSENNFSPVTTTDPQASLWVRAPDPFLLLGLAVALKKLPGLALQWMVLTVVLVQLVFGVYRLDLGLGALQMLSTLPVGLLPGRTAPPIH